MWLVLATFAAGFFAWTLLEYAIHGWLGHRFHTFVTPMHAVHHRDPRAVFAIGAWLPAAALLAILYAAFGWSPATVFYASLVCGFIAYEVIHYRLHFATRLTHWERELRAHHLAHHFARPQACFGVTTRLWDRVFGTDWNLPGPLRQAIAQVPPLSGPSNLAYLLGFDGRRQQRAV